MQFAHTTTAVAAKAIAVAALSIGVLAGTALAELPTFDPTRTFVRIDSFEALIANNFSSGTTVFSQEFTEGEIGMNTPSYSETLSFDLADQFTQFDALRGSATVSAEVTPRFISLAYDAELELSPVSAPGDIFTAAFTEAGNSLRAQVLETADLRVKIDTYAFTTGTDRLLGFEQARVDAGRFQFDNGAEQTLDFLAGSVPDYTGVDPDGLALPQAPQPEAPPVVGQSFEFLFEDVPPLQNNSAPNQLTFGARASGATASVPEFFRGDVGLARFGYRIEVEIVPAPGAMGLFGAAGLCAVRRRRRG